MENLLVLRIKLIFICICISSSPLLILHFFSTRLVLALVHSLIPSLCHLLLSFARNVPKFLFLRHVH